MLRFLLHRAANKTHMISIFLIIHLLRYTKPAVAQFVHCVRCVILLLREQKQRPCEGIKTSTPPSTGWARTYVIQRRPYSAGFALPNIFMILPDGCKIIFIYLSPIPDSFHDKPPMQPPGSYCIPSDTVAHCCLADPQATALLQAHPELLVDESAGRALAGHPFLKCV